VKVCFVTTSFIRSDRDHYARFVYEQAKSLRIADSSVSVVVVAPHAQGLAIREVIDGLEVRRARYFWPEALQCLAYQHEGLFETLRKSWLATVQLPLLLTSLLFGLWRASKGAQIIHAQWVPTAAIAVIVGRLRRIPVVVSVRGADLNTARNSRLGRFLTRAVIGRVSQIVTVSDEFRRVLASELECEKPLAALYNGVDTVQFQPRDKGESRQRLGLPADAAIVLYVGGLIERKGVNTLIRALARTTPAGRPVTTYVAGEGPQHDVLKALAESEGLGDRVHFVGKVAKDQMHLWMGAADVLVLPSYSEGRPNVVLEAMATGTPVIASRIDGTTEIISDGDDGLLFPPGDVDALAANLNRVLLQPDVAVRLAMRGPRKISALGLTWSAHGRRLLSIYHELLADG